ncbi:MAG: DUF3828 domain-containing protein [Rhizobiales bacterium]|nr:DUF3828 domain-containing protein [Hyphomicrobiales bacterium]
MIRRIHVLAFLAALALPFAPLPVMAPPVAAAEKASDAETVIRAIYAQYSKDGWPEDAEKKNFSPSLFAKWDEVQQAADAANEVGVDFDVFLDAQDTDTVTDLTTRFTPDGADKGKVEATFTAFDSQTTVTYDMVKTDGWKIDNISWGPDRDDLRKTLAAIREDQKSGGSGGSGGDDEDAD